MNYMDKLTKQHSSRQRTAVYTL